MKMRMNKAALLIAMVVLLGVYFYLNINKIDFVSGQYAQIIQGEYAPTVTLSLAGKSLVDFRLSSSSFFDAEGKRQVSFHRLGQKIFEQLKSRIQEVQVMLAGNTIAVQAKNEENYMIFELPQRKIFLLQKDDLRTMAEILYHERVNRKDVLSCFSVSNLCETLHITVDGLGLLEGPYLKTDIHDGRRGLPRGRWVNGQATILKITTERGTKVQLSINMLTTTPDLKIRFIGPVLNVSSFQRQEYEYYDGWQFYSLSSLIVVELKPGENNIAIRYLDQQSIMAMPNPGAAYLTNIEIKELLRS